MSQKNLNKKLNNLFKDLNIKKGDKIFLHSNVGGLIQFSSKEVENSCVIFFSTLKKYLGKNGVIIIPTYNYQFTKKKILTSKEQIVR